MVRSIKRENYLQETQPYYGQNRVIIMQVVDVRVFLLSQKLKLLSLFLVAKEVWLRRLSLLLL